MQFLVNGFISGLTTAVLAVAFSVVYLPTRIFHIALGGIYVTAAFISWFALHATGSWTLSVLTSLAGAALLSVACEAFNHALLERKEASSETHLITSLGLYIVFVQILALIWGNGTKSLPSPLNARWSIADITLTSAQSVSAVVSVLSIIAFFGWLQYSKLGLQYRALSDNSKELSLRGYNVRQLRLLAFGVSGGLAAISALLTAYDLGFDPHIGLPDLLLAVVAVLIGGRHTFVGPVVAALLLGVVRSGVVWFLSAQWQEAVTFLILAAFLYLRPQGLVGRSTRLEVSG